MGFNDLISRSNGKTLATFANCTVTGQLAGVGVRTFRAILDINQEVASEYEMNQYAPQPQLTALSADIGAIAGVQTFDVTRDGESEGKRYSFNGKPRPDGAGLTVVLLAEKK